MYRALYRKWRPRDFDDVYGQPHVTRTLKTEIETGRISHAYLFTGSRGTGKTTCAKILSKAVNCPNAKNGNPCNECEICKGIDSGSIMDVIEIDAASNNSVENVRDIREEANFTPAQAKYRVYIIDEVHMLSASAFNALLKTLEEPPSHVIFILATTDIQKLPSTILSRCQRFDFKRIPPEEITARLNFVAQQENVTISDDAANLIANISDGGMRDALSLMDSCLAISSDITAETVSTAAGIAGTEHLFAFSECIAKTDFTGALTLVSKLHSEACDISNICTGLSSHFRNLMVAKTVSDCKGLIVCSDRELEKYRQRAAELTISKIIECIDILAKTGDSLRGSTNKKILMESAVIKMCGVKNTDKGTQFYPAAEERIIALEQQVAVLMSGKVAVSAPAQPELKVPEFRKEELKTEAEIKPEAKKEQKQEVKIPEQSTAKEPSVPDLTKEPEIVAVPDGPFGLWPEIVETVSKFNKMLYAFLSDTTAVGKDGKIIIQTENPTLKKLLIEEDRYKDLAKAIIEVTGCKMRAAVSYTGAVKKQEGQQSPLEGMLNKIKEFNGEN